MQYSISLYGCMRQNQAHKDTAIFLQVEAETWTELDNTAGITESMQLFEAQASCAMYLT